MKLGAELGEYGPLVDSFGRVARKLRISVTDRCNFRCSFCMPKNPVWLDRREVLTLEEIARLTRIFVRMGVDRVRLTGGEPLVRRGVVDLVRMLRGIEGLRSLAMTTNGYYLAELAEQLKSAGLESVTVSLHSLKPERYEEVIGVRGVFDKVVEGVRRALEVGMRVKLNVVVIRGCNDDELLDFAKLSRETGVVVRFIEYMPFDGERLWRPELVVSGREVVEAISRAYPLVQEPREPGSTSKNYRFADGSPGGIGVITSITEPFCSDCDRVRLTADGRVVPCLFSKSSYDVRPLLRGGASDGEIASFIREAFRRKFAGVEALLRSESVPEHVRAMYTIGG
ncbi:MAG: GTP 3',8-cyclase MoaA [Nitrososphaerota archaeon]|nr:GTP 3',8-cyclase MoaA [Nitrososphaerota archaeon]